jgi:hypothetical protein
MERKKRNYFSINTKQKYNNREKFRKFMSKADAFARSIGLHITKIELNKYDNFSVNEKFKIVINQNQTENQIGADEKLMPFKCLLAKDQANLSDRKYKLVKKYLGLKLTGLNKVKVLSKQINNIFTIEKNRHGYFSEF